MGGHQGDFTPEVNIDIEQRLSKAYPSINLRYNDGGK